MTRSSADLSALSRREQLTTAEAAELRSLLNDSPEEHFWHAAGCALDAEEAAADADPAAVARVLARLEQAAAPRKLVPRRRAPLWLMAAAAALVVVGAAAAVVRLQRAHEASPAPSSAPSAPRTALPADAPRTAFDTEAPAPVASEAPASLAPSAIAPIAPIAPIAQRSAAELLSDAGRARREGHSAQAIAQLESLQARFPSSAEAVASDIMLGSLLLQSGSAVVALQHYDRYLRRSPGGSLAPEAIWGRAQALSRLGNSVAAQQSLNELVQRFPSSPYASSARAKLHALEPGH
jgi:TolA-binding protein